MWRTNLAMMRGEKAKLFWRRRHIEYGELIYADASYTRNGETGIRDIVSADGDTN